VTNQAVSQTSTKQPLTAQQARDLEVLTKTQGAASALKILKLLHKGV